MSDRVKYGSFTIGWVVVIYSTLYIVRPISDFLRGFAYFEQILSLLVLGLIIGVSLFCFLKFKIRFLSTYFLLLIIFAAYVYGLSTIKYPDEKIHFLQYGLLAYFIYRALIKDLKPLTTYLTAAILTALLGWGDEGIQHLLPNRYYDINDVILNAVSGLLALGLIFVWQREIGIR